MPRWIRITGIVVGSLLALVVVASIAVSDDPGGSAVSWAVVIVTSAVALAIGWGAYRLGRSVVRRLRT